MNKTTIIKTIDMHSVGSNVVNISDIKIKFDKSTKPFRVFYALQKFSFGSCDTTVVVEETLIFAILKDFGLHKKVAQVFFER
jgi:hypothetical protein